MVWSECFTIECCCDLIISLVGLPQERTIVHNSHAKPTTCASWICWPRKSSRASWRIFHCSVPVTEKIAFPYILWLDIADFIFLQKCEVHKSTWHHFWGNLTTEVFDEEIYNGQERWKMCSYLIFFIFFTQAKFLENKIYTEKRVTYDKLHSKLPTLRVNYDKLHSKLPIFRVESVKIYTGQIWNMGISHYFFANYKIT